MFSHKPALMSPITMFAKYNNCFFIKVAHIHLTLAESAAFFAVEFTALASVGVPERRGISYLH